MILYMCPKCIAKTIAEVDEEMTSTRRSARPQVSG
jgi:phage FluMu protein Com